MSDNIDIYIDSAPIDVLVSGAQGPASGGGGSVTSYVDDIESLDDYPATFPPDVSAIADGAIAQAKVSGLVSALSGKQATLTNYSTISALTGYPSSFTPSSHTHPWSQVTGDANHIPFDITPTSVPTAEGTISWNADDHTLDIATDIAGVVQQVGQEQHVRVRNTTGSTISNGAAVYLSGASGQRPTVALADADNDTHVVSTIGLATADIAHNAFGFVTTGGLVRGINTTGMTEGAPIYLSSTAGGMTQTAPTSNIVRVGFCIVAGNNGTVLVHVEKMSIKSADVLDSSTGGNGAADDGKLVEYDSVGNLSCASVFADFLITAGREDASDGEIHIGSIEGAATKLVGTAGALNVTISFPAATGRVALTSQTNGSITTDDVTGLAAALANKEDTLVSGTSIKTVAGISLLGSTNIPALLTDPTGITGADALTNIVSLTQAEYDAIGSKSPTTLYVIT